MLELFNENRTDFTLGVSWDEIDPTPIDEDGMLAWREANKKIPVSRKTRPLDAGKYYGGIADKWKRSRVEGVSVSDF